MKEEKGKEEVLLLMIITHLTRVKVKILIAELKWMSVLSLLETYKKIAILKTTSINIVSNHQRGK